MNEGFVIEVGYILATFFGQANSHLYHALSRRIVTYKHSTKGYNNNAQKQNFQIILDLRFLFVPSDCSTKVKVSGILFWFYFYFLETD